MHKHIFIANKLLLLFSQLYHGKLKNKHSKNGKNTYLYEINHHEYNDEYLNFNWTKSAVKQFLYYISIVNPDGEAYFVEDSDIMSNTHLSLRTIEENNRLFQKGNLLTYQRIQGKAFHISIHNFQENIRDVLKLEEGYDAEVSVTSGYTAIESDKMKKILAIENVNELRFVLRGFVWYEKDIYINRANPEEWFVSADRLFTAVPKYLRYPAAIRKIASKVNAILPFQVITNYEDLKNLFREYGNRGEKVVNIFKQRMVGVLSKFEDSKTKRLKEFTEAQHEMLSFQLKMKQSDIRVQILENKKFQALIDKYGVQALKKAFKRIEGYLMTFLNQERVGLITQLTHDFENFLYSIIKRIDISDINR